MRSFFLIVNGQKYCLCFRLRTEREMRGHRWTERFYLVEIALGLKKDPSLDSKVLTGVFLQIVEKCLCHLLGERETGL